MSFNGIMDKVKVGGLLKAATAALAVLIAVFALMLARDVITLAVSARDTGVQASAESRVAPEERKKLTHYAPILENNVFGFPGERLRPLSTGGLVEARPQGITLRGTIAAEDGTGYAIVEDGAGRQSVYGYGKRIEGVGTLRRVERDRITVEDGAEERQYELADILKITDISAVRATPMRGGPMGGAPAGMARQTTSGSFVVNREAVREALENPEQVMTDARMLPNVVNGKQEGFVMSEVKEGGVFQTLGLRDGDVLTRINSFTLDTPESALKALSAIGGMETIELDVTRDGRKVRLTYVLR